jgi:hypothetical protein
MGWGMCHAWKRREMRAEFWWLNLRGTEQFEDGITVLIILK